MGSFGGGSSSGKQNSTSTSSVQVPSQLGPLIGPQGIVPQQLTQGLTSGQIPSIGNLIQNYPLQGIAGLTPQQQAVIAQYEQFGANPFALNSQENQAGNIYSNVAGDANNGTISQPFAGITGGDVGSAFRSLASGQANPYQSQAANIYDYLAGGPNVAVPYGENVFESMTAPTVESQASLAGLGNSGAAGENLAMAGEQMALPLAEEGLNLESTAASGLAGLGSQIESGQEAGAGGLAAAREAGIGLQQSAANQQLAAASGLTNLGTTSFNQGMQNLTNSLQAAGMSQQQAQEVANALFNQQMGQTNTALNTQNTLMSWLPKLLGQNTTSSGSNSGTNYNFSTGFGDDGSGSSSWFPQGLTLGGP